MEEIDLMGLDGNSTLEKFIGAIRSMNGPVVSFTFRLQNANLAELVMSITESGRKKEILVRIKKEQFSALNQILSRAGILFTQAEEVMKIKVQMESERKVKEALERDGIRTQIDNMTSVEPGSDGKQ